MSGSLRGPSAWRSASSAPSEPAPSTARSGTESRASSAIVSAASCRAPSRLAAAPSSSASKRGPGSAARRARRGAGPSSASACGVPVPSSSGLTWRSIVGSAKVPPIRAFAVTERQCTASGTKGRNRSASGNSRPTSKAMASVDRFACAAGREGGGRRTQLQPLDGDAPVLVEVGAQRKRHLLRERGDIRRQQRPQPGGAVEGRAGGAVGRGAHRACHGEREIGPEAGLEVERCARRRPVQRKVERQRLARLPEQGRHQAVRPFAHRRPSRAAGLPPAKGAGRASRGPRRRAAAPRARHAACHRRAARPPRPPRPLACRSPARRFPRRRTVNRSSATATGRLGRRGNTPSEGGCGSGGGVSEGKGGRLISILLASIASIRRTRRSNAE